MIKQAFGPRRCRATRKPSVQCPEVVFYRCKSCGMIHQRIGRGQSEALVTCCGERMEVLTPVPVTEIRPGGDITYQIVGGYNENAVKVSWKFIDPGQELEWLYLKTYTGGYMKYIIPGKRPPVVFALADEDAFCYCDEDPCLECTFWCKRGFIIYGSVKGLGLFEAPLDKASAYWQSGAAR